MFTPQPYNPGHTIEDVYDSSRGRAMVPLGDDPGAAGLGKGEDTERADVDAWWNPRYNLTAAETGGGFAMAGRGDRAPLPPTRVAQRFLPGSWHDAGGGSVGGAELRANYGGHVIIRRMPNAGQVQGGMAPIPWQPNQLRQIPPHWDAAVIIGAPSS